MVEMLARNPDFASRVRESFTRQSFMETLGVELVSVEPGRVELRLPYDPGLCQQHGFFHGGVIGTLADSIDHKAKIMALGDSILDTTRPEVIRALGTWPMSEMDTDEDGEERINVGKTRIAQVKNLLGKDFDILLTWGPTVVLEAGNWSDSELKMLQPYMPYLNRGVMEHLARLPLKQGMDVLDGLSRRLGNSFIETDLREPDGMEVVGGIVGEVISMNKRLSTPDNLRRLILETRMLDQYMGKFLKRKTSLAKPVERSG